MFTYNLIVTDANSDCASHDSSRGFNYLSKLAVHPPQAKLAEHGDDSIISTGVANSAALRTTNVLVAVLIHSKLF